MSVRSYVTYALILLLTGCIGTDILEEEFAEPELRITSSFTAIEVGGQAQFEAIYFNDLGEIESVDLTWFSSDDNIISIDNTGLASALQSGMVLLNVVGQNLKDSVMVEAGSQTISQPTERNGSLQGRSNYVITGTISLRQSQDGSLDLYFGNDFQASNGPGLYVYLSNAPNSVTGAVEIGPLKANSGAQQYNIPSQVTINMFDFVVIYCKPFGVPFGFGEFD